MRVVYGRATPGRGRSTYEMMSAQLVALASPLTTGPLVALFVSRADATSAIAPHHQRERDGESSHSRRGCIGPFCRRSIGPSGLCDAGFTFAKGCADDEKLGDALHKLNEPPLSHLIAITTRDISNKSVGASCSDRHVRSPAPGRQPQIFFSRHCRACRSSVSLMPAACAIALACAKPTWAT